MSAYMYRNFKVVYKVYPQDAHHLYKADGLAICLESEEFPYPQTEFSTEYPTYEGAQTEIKKIIEEYIDFEWSQSVNKQKHKEN